MSNSRELSDLASQVIVQGDLITFPNVQVMGNISAVNFDLSGNISVLGNATIGNAPTDTLSINSAINYTGSLTGGTGIINIGSGQVFKDAAGNVGIGTATLLGKFNLSGSGAITQFITSTNGQAVRISFDSSGAILNWLQGSSAGLQFATADTLRATLDPAGNLGLGVTPVAGLNFRSFQINRSIFDGGVSDRTTVSYNYARAGGVNTYIGTDFASSYLQSGGSHSWLTAPSGTAGAPISFGDPKMSLTQGGNLLVGTTSEAGSNSLTTVSSGATVNGVFSAVNAFAATFVGANNTGGTVRGVSASTVGFGTADTVPLSFGTNNTERARITSAGYFKADAQGQYLVETGASDINTLYYSFHSNQTFNIVARARSTATTSYYSGLQVGATGLHYQGATGGAVNYQVLANGNVQNTNNSYGAISDLKLKENITDAPSYLDKFMNIRFVNYNLIGSELKQFGVIAQELEQIGFSGLIEETPDTHEVTKTREVQKTRTVTAEDGTETEETYTETETYTEREPNGEVTKAVKYSVLSTIQGKVIQELNEKITTLEEQLSTVLQRLQDLENK